MSKGWTVKVGTQIVVNIDTNIGVVASTEEKAGGVAQETVTKDIVNSYLDSNKADYIAQISAQIPWNFEIAGMSWSRSGKPDIDFDTMCALNIEPDTDFDPEEDEVKEDAAVGRDLMEAAQCLNEAYHNLGDGPLQMWGWRHGIAEVRDQLNLCAIYCDNLYRLMKDEQGYDLPFDFEFCPQFLENCVDHETFKPKSTDMRVLSMYFSRIGA